MDDMFAPHDGSPSQWPDSIPMLSDLNDVYEPAPCPPPVQQLSESRYDDHFNSPIEPPIDVPSFNWTYDTSSPSGSPYPGFASETGFSGNTLSPSISIVSSSPRSDNGVLPVTPSNEYNGAFEFDYGNSLPPDAYPSRSSWSNPSPINLSPSPSPSNLDVYEIQSSTSRDNSPVRGHDCDKADKRRFPCLILGCNRRFTSQYTLKVHMEAHKPKPKVTFPCTEGCSERFSRQHDRLRHEVAKHGKISQGSTRWVTS
ncbi:hypothetical protein H1R20_g4391, partial [Candolleomyces eurysporus]